MISVDLFIGVAEQWLLYKCNHIDLYVIVDIIV